MPELAEKPIKINDIVQITNINHKWFQCLVVVDELKNFGCVAYIEIPTEGKAFIRLEHTDYEIVGKAIVVMEDKNATS